MNTSEPDRPQAAPRADAPSDAPCRRAVLTGIAAAIGASAIGPLEALAQDRPAAMSFDDLRARARAMAAAPFAETPNPAPAVMERIDYDAHWKIRFRKDAALTPAGDDAPVELFHPGRYFPQPVEIHERAADGSAREVPFTETAFDMPADSPAHDLPGSAGWAGFRVMRPGDGPDWVSFLGASYFRTDGPEAQYGLSARGIAVNTGLSEPEEFPRFTAFWIGPPEAEGDDLSVWALLDGPSIAGAYRFGMARGREGEDGHSMRVEAHLFARNPVSRLGIAPLTSMFWYSERTRGAGADWRPEIHDSDGLAMHTGAGERIWRALGNPPHVATASFFDRNPRGFGLVQRDRDFANYQDDGVFYDRRPSAWITPEGDWGAGAVQLIEIPTDDETFDNIVAYWAPETLPEPGEEAVFAYRLDWRARDPEPDAVARVVATRQGPGGIPGGDSPEGVDKMVVDFEGPALDGLTREDGVEAVITLVGGALTGPNGAHPVVDAGGTWRMNFDFAADGTGPVTMRAHLQKDGTPLTETWMADAWIGARA